MAADPAEPERSRPQVARLRPEQLARRRGGRGGALEGLAWLGREPEARAGRLYRTTALVARFILFGLLRLRIDVSGSENVPDRGGYLVVAAVHRGWLDPFVILHALPLEPRAWFLGSGPSAFSARWREWFLHRLGGMLPVWRGGVGVDQHVASAKAVLAAGGVFVLVPEGGVSGPPDALAPFRNGASLIAIRTDAPILPIAIAGTAELYVGRRAASRILPLTTSRNLLGAAWDGVPPAEGSREELDLARALTSRLEVLLGPAVGALYPETVDRSGRRRVWRGLTWLFLARPNAARPDPARPH